MKTRILALAVLSAILLPILSPAALAVQEAPSSWAVEPVNTALSLGLVPEALVQAGYRQPATRAEFCALAVTAYEKLKGPITGRKTFSDTQDVNVEKAAYAGIVEGMGKNRFAPEEKLNREQAAVMLARLMSVCGQPLAAQAASFADAAQISSWAAQQVGQVQRAGIMVGEDGNRFNPKGTYTIEQSIVTVLRAFEKIKGAAVLQPLPIPASLKKGMTAAEFQQAYDIAYALVKDLAGLSREEQLIGMFSALCGIRHSGSWDYSMEVKHYNNVYGFFVRRCTSCAGDVRAAGLCLTLLGIPYEHVNENQYEHQWARVELNGDYVVVDVNGGFMIYEEEPYQHPFLSY